MSAQGHEARSVRRSFLRLSGRIAAYAGAGILALFIFVLAVILIGANTGAGRRLIMQQTASLTGNTVLLSGLGGRFPDNLRLEKIEIKDAQGVWLKLTHLHLNWSPLALVSRTAKVYTATADQLDIPRLPVSDGSTSESSDTPYNLGIKIDIQSLALTRINVGAALAGQAASFGLQGHARLSSLDAVLNGLSLKHLPSSVIDLHVKRLDQVGQVNLMTTTDDGKLALHLDAHEDNEGFTAKLLKLPQLTPLSVVADMKGRTTAEALTLNVGAGPVTLKGEGTLDLVTKRFVSLQAGLDAPQMTLRPDIGWGGIHLDAQLQGDMMAPDGHATLEVDRLAAAGAGAGTLRVDFSGQTGHKGQEDLLHLLLTAQGIRLPGPAPLLLASAPLRLDASLHPGESGKPLDFDLSHPLLHLNGHVMVAAPQKGTLTLALPDLKPLAQIAKTPLEGHAGVDAGFALPASPEGDTHINAKGQLAVTGGQAQAVGLIGSEGTFALDTILRSFKQAVSEKTEEKPHVKADKQKVATTQVKEGTQVDVQHFSLDGQALHLTAQGLVNLGQDMKVTASLALTDLKKILPSLRGALKLDLNTEGPMDDFGAGIHLEGTPGTATMPPGPVTFDARLAHLPSAPEGTLMAQGSVDKAPLLLDAAFSQAADGVRELHLNKLSWNSLQGKGDLSLPQGAVLPLGDLTLKIDRLADFRNMTGQQIMGTIAASVQTTQEGAAPRVALKVNGHVTMPQVTVGNLSLAGSVLDPVQHPDADLTLKLSGLAASGVTGQAAVTAKGPENAMLITALVGPASWSKSPLALDVSSVLNLPAKQVRIQRLSATAKEETLKLQAPVQVSFGDEVGVDRLRAILTTPGASPATIDVAGRVKPKIAMTANIQHLTPALAHPFMPSLHAQGDIALSAVVNGMPGNLTGRAQLTGRDLRLQGSSALASLPALAIDAKAEMAGDGAHVTLTTSAGSKFQLGLTGTAPLSSTGPVDMRANGRLDLSIANGVLGAQGREARGVMQLDMRVAGRLPSPVVTGAIDLQKAEFQDFAQGVRLSDINGHIVGEKDHIVIQSLTAKAGKGTIGVAGSAGVLAPGMPVDVRITAKNASPVASDLLTAAFNADIAIKGQATTRIDVDGNVNLQKVNVNIPSSLPTSVAQLDVIRPGQQAAAPAEHTEEAHAVVIGLDLQVISPGMFYVRGHGLDAEMAGNLLIKGTASNPNITGGFDLKRGNFDLAGISLNFTRGRVAFNGSGVSHKLDPTLNFEADRSVQGRVAMLKVEGYASEPRISFSSTPELPQDQVLALLLFGTDGHALSSAQMIELGAALATLSGVTTFDPMGMLRKTLGLDRLAIGGGSGVGNGGTTVEAGKYVMKGVYVGAKQSTSGAGTQAQVQVDLTKHLKLNTTVGTGGNVTGFTTPENDPGSSVGLLWEYRY